MPRWVENKNPRIGDTPYRSNFPLSELAFDVGNLTRADSGIGNCYRGWSCAHVVIVLPMAFGEMIPGEKWPTP